jgi:inner membrane protein
MGWQVFQDKPLAGKLTVIALIMLGLMIPLTMLRSLITERSQMRAQAIATVAKGWGGSVQLGGLMLRVPFDVQRKSTDGVVIVEPHQLYLLANDLNIDATIDHTIIRHVGIYGVPVYLMHAKLSGSFKMADLVSRAGLVKYPNTTFHWNAAAIRLPVSDVRSIREIPVATISGHVMSFGPSSGGGFSGVESDLDLSEYSKATDLPFALDVVLAGSQSVSFLPTAVVSRAALSAAWPDPEFQGSFLPSHYAIDAKGFQAQWQVLALNRGFPHSWIDGEVDCATIANSSYGAELFQSVDVYQRSERAVKYAFLFIALTFLSFFAWECLAKLDIHPMQYLLIGLALSTFYLLLIALSEHLPFWLSFWMAAVALVTLLGVYIAGATDRIRSGVIVAALMSLVYGLLYLLVLSEI